MVAVFFFFLFRILKERLRYSQRAGVEGAKEEGSLLLPAVVCTILMSSPRSMFYACVFFLFLFFL